MPQHMYPLSQPNPPKQQYDRCKEAQPRLPPDARLLRHPQHAIHRTLQFIPRVLKLIVHLFREGRRIANLVPDQVCQLSVQTD
jgi:hypothetical protein